MTVSRRHCDRLVSSQLLYLLDGCARHCEPGVLKEVGGEEDSTDFQFIHHDALSLLYGCAPLWKRKVARSASYSKRALASAICACVC